MRQPPPKNYNLLPIIVGQPPPPPPPPLVGVGGFGEGGGGVRIMGNVDHHGRPMKKILVFLSLFLSNLELPCIY